MSTSGLKTHVFLNIKLGRKIAYKAEVSIDCKKEIICMLNL